MLPDETLTRKSENSSVSATRARQTARKWASAWLNDAVLLICIRHRYTQTYETFSKKRMSSTQIHIFNEIKTSLLSHC